MYSIFIVTIAASALSLVLTPLLRRWSFRFGLVDRPDSRRKLHSAATPRTGGIAILASYLGAYGLLLLLPLSASGLVASNLGTVWPLMAPVGLVFLTGLLDDWLDIRPWQKVAGQVIAAVWAFAAGVRVLSVGGWAVPPWCGFLLTVGWLVLCSNAFNLIDGMDGLAAGVGLTATLTTFAAGVIHGDLALGLATAPLAGCLLGFLRYNFNPASIFLGDSGSLSIGFLLGTYAVIWNEKSATMLGFAAPMMALALPLLEVGLSILRRFLGGEPIFGGDRGHIHHRLLDFGLTPRRAVLLLYGICAVGAVLSLVESMMANRVAAILIVLFGAGAAAGVWRLGYVEFQAARRFLWARLRPTLSAHVKLEVLERALQSAASVDECWLALERSARSLGYSHVTVRLAGRQFITAPALPRDSAAWQMRLNLPRRDYVNVTQCGEGQGQPMLLIPFVELLGRLLPAKLAQFEGSEQPAECGASADSLMALRAAIEKPVHSGRNSSTRTVMSSDCTAPSVNAATAS
jgi:UDP-GlcNAc:undecaprenyl-phosphate/decaprenyl-phosphate GlcNAc-1-phosphate transferase